MLKKQHKINQGTKTSIVKKTGEWIANKKSNNGEEHLDNE